MEYDFEIYRLSAKFIADYPTTKYPELMYKNARPYNCLLLESHDNYFICIPFRSHINLEMLIYSKIPCAAEPTAPAWITQKL